MTPEELYRAEKAKRGLPPMTKIAHVKFLRFPECGSSAVYILKARRRKRGGKTCYYRCLECSRLFRASVVAAVCGWRQVEVRG